MNYSRKKIHSFGKVHGGKNRYSRAYIPLFPPVSEFPIYVEPFCGGTGILMNKERSGVEIISDIDPDIYNVLTQLRDWPSGLINFLRAKYGEYSEETFQMAKSELAPSNKSLRRRAAAYIAANRMSRGGMFRDFAWSDRHRGGQPGDKNAWENFIHGEIEYTAQRLQMVDILNESAFDVIKKYDMEECILYADPPYLHSTRVSKNIYKYEFNEDDHIKFLELIVNFKGKAFISGYDSQLYRDYLKGWKTHSFHRPNDSGQTKIKTRRVEQLWESP